LVKTLIHLCWIWLCCIRFGYAASVVVKVHPENPIAGEVFELRFEIEGSFDSEPFISFDKSNAEVLGKEEQEPSLSTTIINGRISTKKIARYFYRMKLDRAGSLRIRNIKTLVDNEEIRSNDILVTVLQERKEPDEIFLKAEVSQEQAYVGEAIRVDYYLYYRVFIRAPEIREFPKLNGFIKRFYMPNETPVRVEQNGEIYQKSAKYSALLFPEKAGELSVDALKLNVEYEFKRGNAQVFGPFGFAAGQFRQKYVTSEKVVIKTIPLPLEKMPKNFTGLVGHHKFNLKMDKAKFLINEPIEFSLEVEGAGALEKMDEPILFHDNNLEKFDTKSELTEISPGHSKKVFGYTYLGRGPLKIGDSSISLSYFDPRQATYIDVTLSLPALEVIGTALPSIVKDTGKDFQSPSQKVSVPVIPPSSLHQVVLAPIFSETLLSKFHNISFINKCLIGLHLLVLLLLASSFGRKMMSPANEFDTLLRKLRRGKINYNQFLMLIDFFRSGPSESLDDIINRMRISMEARNYLKSYLKKVEKNFYDLNAPGSTVKFDKKYIGQIKKIGPPDGYIARSSDF